MKIVSWNINSFKARRDHVKRFLTETKPDVLMVQELKGLDIPNDVFSDIGYTTQSVAQKTYNGVAVFSKYPIDVVRTELSGDSNDTQARYIECIINNMRIINVYCPNGNPVDTEKYDYKLSWMNRLYARLKYFTDNSEDFLIGGDFNVIPEPHDCHDPNVWHDDALFRLQTRQSYRRLINIGLYDAFRVYNTASEQYTFWDYQAGAWPKNNGIRIDHFLLSSAYVDRLDKCTIDSAPRGWDKPSDHTPIILELCD